MGKSVYIGLGFSEFPVRRDRLRDCLGAVCLTRALADAEDVANRQRKPNVWTARLPQTRITRVPPKMSRECRRQLLAEEPIFGAERFLHARSNHGKWVSLSLTFWEMVA